MNNPYVLKLNSFSDLQIPSTAVIESTAGLLPRGFTNRRLVLSVRTNEDWEILIYRHGDLFEACFFRWAVHHEHATGSSFETVSHLVEQRIRVLEARNLKSTEWRQMIH